jgi:hypothetical protein
LVGLNKWVFNGFGNGPSSFLKGEKCLDYLSFSVLSQCSKLAQTALLLTCIGKYQVRVSAGTTVMNEGNSWFPVVIGDNFWDSIFGHGRFLVTFLIHKSLSTSHSIFCSPSSRQLHYDFQRHTHAHTHAPDTGTLFRSR